MKILSNIHSYKDARDFADFLRVLILLGMPTFREPCSSFYQGEEYQAAIIILVQINMDDKTTLLIINPLTFFGSLLSYFQRQYDDVITKIFFTN